ncbi:hypothetical protein BJY00DRAFT_283988 [Aspergillus carlsbadensis]|nr:hypothetical protein BJY00DRAFT_283988 [Aspergillus carlsbadensis]
MKHLNVGLAAALSLPLGIWAAECETTSENDPETGETILRVHSPDQLDVFGDDCTTIVGHILIESDYSGDFVLNGVSEFKGNISAPLIDYGDKLNAFEMLDLTTIDAIFLPKVVDVRLPSLEHAGNIYLAQSSVGEVDLGSLVEAGHVGVQGDWTGINLGSLQRATQVDISGTYSWDVPEGEEPVSIVVDLPALEAANYFGVSGLFESLSLPRLTTLGEHRQGVDYLYQTYAEGRPYTYISGRPGLRISSANHIPIEVPELEFLSGSLQVYGNVTSFRLPSLGESDVDIEFNTDTHLHIFSTLESTGNLWLWGNIATVDLPNIEHVDSISIAYRDRLPCNETLLKLWRWSQDDYDQYKCFKLDDQFLDDGSDEEEEEEDTGSDSPDDTTNGDTTGTSPSNDNPASEEQDTTEDSTEDSAGDTNSDETFDGSGGRIVSHTGVAMLIAAVVLFCCW